MKRTTRVVFDWVVGVTLIVLGIAGGFIPILQGWPFIIAGLAVLSSHSRWANALYQRVKTLGRQVRDRVLHRRDRVGSDED